MKEWAWVLVVLGLGNVGLGWLSRRWGSPYWGSRIGVGLVVTMAGVYGLWAW